MPQNPLNLQQFYNPVPTQIGAGGMKTIVKTSAAAIKTSTARVCLIKITNMGTTSGAFTLNDCTTTGAATAANVILTIPFTAVLYLNNPTSLEFQCVNGLTLSAVPG